MVNEHSPVQIWKL